MGCSQARVHTLRAHTHTCTHADAHMHTPHTRVHIHTHQGWLSSNSVPETPPLGVAHTERVPSPYLAPRVPGRADKGPTELLTTREREGHGSSSCQLSTQ